MELPGNGTNSVYAYSYAPYTISTQLSAGRRGDGTNPQDNERFRRWKLYGRTAYFQGPGTFYFLLHKRWRNYDNKFGLAPCSVKGYTCVL